MILSIHALGDDQKVLSGVQSGRRLFAKIVACVSHPPADEVAFLDFAGVEVATGSFLRESIMAFRDYARTTLPKFYPVVANPSAPILEELDFVLKHRKDAMWTCSLDIIGRPIKAMIVGELEASHRAAFDLVAALGSASAPDLAARGDGSVGPTAWNNRLAFLVAHGLLRERRTGKSKTFVPVLETL